MSATVTDIADARAKRNARRLNAFFVLLVAGGLAWVVFNRKKVPT
jgi:hypothetical protein